MEEQRDKGDAFEITALLSSISNDLLSYRPFVYVFVCVCVSRLSPPQVHKNGLLRPRVFREGVSREEGARVGFRC